MADLEVMQDLIDGVADAMEVFGKEIILRSFSKSGPDYNPVLTPVDLSVLGIQIDFKLEDRDGENISATDKKYLVEAKDIAGNPIYPNRDMRIVDDIEYQIKNVEEVKPADTSIMYILQVGL